MSKKEQPHRPHTFLPLLGAVSALAFLFLARSASLQGQLFPSFCEAFPRFCPNVQIDAPETFNPYTSSASFSSSSAMAALLPGGGTGQKTICDFLPDVCRSSSTSVQSSIRFQFSNSSLPALPRCAPFQVTCQPFSTFECPCLESHFIMVCPDTGCGVCPICDPPPPPSSSSQTAFSIASIPIVSSQSSSIYNGQPTDVSLTMRLIDSMLIHKNGSARIRVSVQNTGTVEATNVRVTGSIPGILGNPTSLQPNMVQTSGCSFQGLNYECTFATLQPGQASEAILAITIPSEYQAGRCPGLGTIFGQVRTDIPELTQTNNMAGVTMTVQCGVPISSASSRISSSSRASVGGSTADIVPLFRNGLPMLRLGANRLLFRVENTGNLRADFNRLFIAIPQYGQFNPEYSSYFCYGGTAGVTCDVPSVSPGGTVDIDVGFTVSAPTCPQSMNLIARAATQTLQSNTDNDALVTLLPVECSGHQDSSIALSSVGQRSSIYTVSSMFNQSSVIAGTVDLVLQEGFNFPGDTLKGTTVVLPYRIGNLGNGTAENVRAFVLATPATFNRMQSSPFCGPIGSTPNPQFGIGQRIECIIPRIQPGQWVDISLAYDIPEDFPQCPGVIVHPFSVQRRPGELNGQNNDVSSRVLALCEPHSSSRLFQSSQASSVSRAPTNGIDLTVQSITAIGPQPGILDYSQPINYRYLVTVQNIGNTGTDSFLLRTTVADSGMQFVTDGLTDICNVRLETGIIAGKSYIDCETTGFGNGGMYPGRNISFAITMRVPSTYANGQACRQLYSLSARVYEPNGRDVNPSNNEQVHRAGIRCSDGTTTSVAPLEYRTEYGQGMQLLVRQNSPVSMMANGRARFLYAVRNNSSVDTSYSYAVFWPASRFSFDPAISSSGCSLQPDGSIRCALPGLQKGKVALLDLGLAYAGYIGCGTSVPLQVEVDGAAVSPPVGAFRLNRTTVDSIRVDCGNVPSSAPQSSAPAAEGISIRERANNFPTAIARGQNIRLPFIIQNLTNATMTNIRVLMDVPSDNYSGQFSSSICSYNHSLQKVVCTLPALTSRQTYPVDIGVYVTTYANCGSSLGVNTTTEGRTNLGQQVSATIVHSLSIQCPDPVSSQSSVRSSTSVAPEPAYGCLQNVGQNVYCVQSAACTSQLSLLPCGLDNGRCCLDQNIVRDRQAGPDPLLISNFHSDLRKGDLVTFNLVMMNRGTKDTAEARLYIPVPAGTQLRYLAANGSRWTCTSVDVAHPYCTIPPTGRGLHANVTVRILIPPSYQPNKCPSSFTFIPRIEMNKPEEELTLQNNQLILKSRVLCATSQPQGVCCEAGSCNPFGTCSNPFSNYNACTASCGTQTSSTSAGTSGGSMTLSVRNGTPNAIAGENVSLFVRVGNTAGRNLQGASFDVRFPSTINSATTVIANGTCSVRTGNILHCQRSNTLTVGQAWVQRIDFRTNRLLPCSTTSNLSFSTTAAATGVSDVQVSTSVQLPCPSTSSRVSTPTSSRSSGSSRGGGNSSGGNSQRSTVSSVFNSQRSTTSQMSSEQSCIRGALICDPTQNNGRYRCVRGGTGYENALSGMRVCSADRCSDCRTFREERVEYSEARCGDSIHDPGEECDFRGRRCVSGCGGGLGGGGDGPRRLATCSASCRMIISGGVSGDITASGRGKGIDVTYGMSALLALIGVLCIRVGLRKRTIKKG